ncbi:uncharacterized protein LOC126165823 isoform X1 [Schistocerca cancellata]|uniref:uncharacterized protein LOC126165823 isoform X1 n=1 Tax=Schistocerca cancellata TaxID=274614 RepID=UPI002118DD9E|nr:uncharacterized protein LOC126165823 isoform X1 [Schistocerca cancellata]
MGGVCRARNCFRTKDKCPDLPFFTFPKNPISAKKWITNIGDPELLKRPPSALKNNVVCALHFEEKCFVNKKKRSLVRNAVPTIFNIPPFRTQEIHKNDIHSKSERTDVPECNSGALFSCNVESFDNWHRQIDAVTEQLLCLLPENSSHTSQLETQTEKRCVDAFTQYEDESGTREFENKLNDLNKDTNVESSDAVPRVQLLCRLCSKLTHRERVMPIFSYEAEKIHLDVMINSIMPTKVVQDDGLPQQVCKLCVRKLTFCHDVRKEFLASDKRLRDLLGIAAPKDSAEVGLPSTKENVMERSTVLESTSAKVITPPAEDIIKVQRKENEPPSIALQTEETTTIQSETVKRGPRKRKRVMTAVKTKNTRKKDDKIPKLTKSRSQGKKTTAEDTPKLIKSTPQRKKTIAEDVSKLVKSVHGKKVAAEESPNLIKPAPLGTKATVEESSKLIKSAPHGKKAAIEESPKLIKSGSHTKKSAVEESPKLIKPAPHGKKAAAEESPKFIKSAPYGRKAAVEESPKLIKSAPHGKEATSEENPKSIKAGPRGKKTTGEEISKLVETSPHITKATAEEISKLVKTDPHERMTTVEEIPKLVQSDPHGIMATVGEIPNLVKIGPHEKKTTAEESDFENDSNYEIHWYDEAYDDSISEDMGPNDSILNNKKMLVKNAKKQLTCMATKLVTEPVADEEMKNIKENNITTLNHKKLNESKLDDTMVKDIHMSDTKANDTKGNESKGNDSKVNESKVDESNVNKSKVDTGMTVPITNSCSSSKESVPSSGSVRQKIGSGSVKVRLMTERQKLLKLKMKTQNKLLKQGSKKKVLPAKNSCSECNKSFSSKLKLERHILMHSKYECAVCSTIFNTGEELSNHSRENCLSKLKAVTDAAATGHECEICRRTFKTRQRLLLHSKTHSTIITHSTTIPYTCKVCPKAFPTRIRLKQHLKIHKPEKSKSNKAVLRQRVQHTESALTLKCEICSTFFTSVKEYEKHREEHASSSSTIHMNSTSKAAITSDASNADKLGSGSVGSIDTSSVVADVHGVELTKTVKEDGIMKVKVPHLEKNLIITSADQFVCDICDCKFSSKHFQEEHKKVHHSLPKQSSVPVDTSPVESTVELLQTPERGKLYFCDQCGEGYERKRSLALHRFSHTSSHRCPHCHQSFSSEDSLTRHLENCVEVKEETTVGNNQL